MSLYDTILLFDQEISGLCLESITLKLTSPTSEKYIVSLPEPSLKSLFKMFIFNLKSSAFVEDLPTSFNFKNTL